MIGIFPSITIWKENSKNRIPEGAFFGLHPEIKHGHKGLPKTSFVKKIGYVYPNEQYGQIHAARHHHN